MRYWQKLVDGFRRKTQFLLFAQELLRRNLSCPSGLGEVKNLNTGTATARGLLTLNSS